MEKLGRIRMNKPDEAVIQTGLASIERGRQLVHQGYVNDHIGRGKRIAGKLYCAACHSSQHESNKIKELDPQIRLEYADSLRQPFLPGPPLVGMINRIFFFNDDFQKKYEGKHKQLFKDGHNNLRRAIQACNQSFADGRELEKWEVESILLYLWSLELKMGDLHLKEEDLEKVNFSLEHNESNARAVNILRTYYFEVYPATLTLPMQLEARKRISPILNNFNNGRRLYKQSCLHCHQGKRLSSFGLDEDKKTFLYLKKHFDDSTSQHSIYNALRYRQNRKGDQLPHFTAQRLSDKQLQDLRFFIHEMARLGPEAYYYHKIDQ
jgi:mono/diheme cytochrome c family protein